MSVSYVLNNQRLTTIAAQLRPRASAAVRKAAFDIQAHAQTNAPVDTGALQASIQVTETSDLSAEVSTNVEYAIYQEMGTVHMAAQPYMKPAADAVRPSFEAAMARLVE